MPRSSAKCALTSCTGTSPAWAQLMPDAKTMGRWGVAVGPSVLKRIHEQMVRIARDKGITTGRRMRVDTTVVETNIHHPTRSEEHTSELQSLRHLVCRLLLEKKKTQR